jgi:hypothetical protein
MTVPGWFNDMQAVVVPPFPHPFSFVVWPLDYPPESSALAVTRDFSTRALGLTGNAIVVDPHAPPTGQPELTIEIPANHTQLRVVAVYGNGGWGLGQVGNLGGASFYANGPKIQLKPPPGATSATITEVADDGLHHFNLSAADLAAGTAFLAPSYPRSVLVVYANAAGSTLGADGGTF